MPDRERVAIVAERDRPSEFVARILRDYRGQTIHVLAPLVTARKGYYTELAKWALQKGVESFVWNCLMAPAGVPADTTCPGSASTAVTTSSAEYTSKRVRSASNKDGAAVMGLASSSHCWNSAT